MSPDLDFPNMSYYLFSGRYWASVYFKSAVGTNSSSKNLPYQKLVITSSLWCCSDKLNSKHILD